jgi:large subunit ribosomal protein L14
MIFTESYIKVADNSGAVYVKCIKVPGSSKPRFARFGDTIVVSTKIVKPKLKLKENRRIVKGGIYKAILIRTKKPVFAIDGSSTRFFENSVALVKKNQPRTFGGPKLAGSRIFGPIIFNRRLKRKFPKLFSLASSVIR